MYTHLDNFMSRLNVIPYHALTFFVSKPDNAAAKQGQELRSEQTAINIHEQNPLLIFCALTIRKHLLMDLQKSVGAAQSHAGAEEVPYG